MQQPGSVSDEDHARILQQRRRQSRAVSLDMTPSGYDWALDQLLSGADNRMDEQLPHFIEQRRFSALFSDMLKSPQQPIGSLFHTNMTNTTSNSNSNSSSSSSSTSLSSNCHNHASAACSQDVSSLFPLQRRSSFTMLGRRSSGSHIAHDDYFTMTPEQSPSVQSIHRPSQPQSQAPNKQHQEVNDQSQTLQDSALQSVPSNRKSSNSLLHSTCSPSNPGATTSNMLPLASLMDNHSASSETSYFMQHLGADVQIVTSGALFPAHRCILEERSQVFAQYFKEAQNAVSASHIDLSHIPASEFKLVLQYIYEGALTATKFADLPPHFPWRLMLHAEFFGVPQLAIDCQLYIFTRMMSDDTYVDVWNTALNLGVSANYLCNKCLEHAVRNTPRLAGHRTFGNLRYELLHRVLTFHMQIPEGFTHDQMQGKLRLVVFLLLRWSEMQTAVSQWPASELRTRLSSMTDALQMMLPNAVHKNALSQIEKQIMQEEISLMNQNRHRQGMLRSVDLVRALYNNVFAREAAYVLGQSPTPWEDRAPTRTSSPTGESPEIIAEAQEPRLTRKRNRRDGDGDTRIAVNDRRGDHHNDGTSESSSSAAAVSVTNNPADGAKKRKKARGDRDGSETKFAEQANRPWNKYSSRLFFRITKEAKANWHKAAITPDQPTEDLDPQKDA